MVIRGPRWVRAVFVGQCLDDDQRDSLARIAYDGNRFIVAPRFWNILLSLSKHSFTRFAIYTLWAWFVMTLTHEIGHVLGALVSGGSPVVIEIRPWRIPWSLYDPNPHPQITLWAGFVVGTLTPIFVWRVSTRFQEQPSQFVAFVAWFCVVANGIYLLLGALGSDRELDSQQLMQAGANPVLVCCLGFVGTFVGYLGLRKVCQEISESSEHRRLGQVALGLVAFVIIQSILGTLFAILV